MTNFDMLYKSCIIVLLSSLVTVNTMIFAMEVNKDWVITEEAYKEIMVAGTLSVVGYTLLLWGAMLVFKKAMAKKQ